MPFTASDDYKAALAAETTFQSFGLRALRDDGTVFAWTRLRRSIALPELVIALRGDRSISIPATTYQRSSLTVTNLEQSDDPTQADNMEATLTLGVDIDANQVRAGRFDGQPFSLVMFDWKTPAPSGEPTRQILRLRGTLEARRTAGLAVTWSLRGLGYALKRELLETTRATSRARWGDPELSFFDLDTDTDDGFPARVATTVDAVDGTYGRRRFTLADTAGFPADRFTGGRVSFTDGDNAGFTFDVMSWDSATGMFTLYDETPAAIAPGDAVTAQIKPPLTLEEWISYFGSGLGFAAEPEIPTVESAYQVN